MQLRSGRLRDSIRSDVSDDAGGVSGTVWSDSPYAAAQEYGFNGVVTVRETLRRAKASAGFDFRGEGGSRPVRRDKTPTGMVRAHVMRMDLPERSFLRRALEEERTGLLVDLRQTVEGLIP